MNPIEKQRKKTTLSQKSVAEALGVTQGAVSQWENGSAAPRLNKLLKLAEILNCEIGDLLRPDEKKEDKNEEEKHGNN